MGAMTPIAADDEAIRELRAWTFDGWAPWAYDQSVVVLSPIARREGGQESPVTWASAAAELGVPFESLMAGHPSTKSLAAAATAAGMEDQFIWPDDGLVSPVLWSELVKILREYTLASEYLHAGFYLGFGVPDVLRGVATVLDINDASYGFSQVLAGDIYQTPGGLAGMPLFEPSPMRFSPDLSFLWPADKSWFIRVYPDSPFLVVSCKNEMAARIRSDAQFECWEEGLGSPRFEVREG